MEKTRAETDKKALRILVVDDEQVIRSFISRVFEKEGYEVQTAASVKRALKIAASWEFDILLTDIYLGQSTGMDVIRELRKALGKEFPVVVMTGFATEQSIQEVRELNVRNFLMKPLEIPKLVKTVEWALKNPENSGEGVTTPRSGSIGRDARARSCSTPVPSEQVFGRASMPVAIQPSRMVSPGPVPKKHDRHGGATALRAAPPCPSHILPLSVLDSGVQSAYFSNTTLVSALQHKTVFEELARTFSEDSNGRAAAWFEAHPEYSSTLIKFAGSNLFSEAYSHVTVEILLQEKGNKWAGNLVSALTLLDMSKCMYGVKILDPKQTLRHGLMTAAISYILALKSEDLDPEQATIAGLLHDVGKVLLASFHSRAYQRAQVTAATSVLTAEMETEHLGTSHTTFMGALSELWQLPDYLVQTMTRHHDDWIELMQNDNNQSKIALCVKAADIMAHRAEKMKPMDEWLGNIPAGVLNTLGIDGRRLEKSFKFLPAVLQKLLAILPVKLEPGLAKLDCKPDELKDQANATRKAKQVLYIAQPGTPVPAFLVLNRAMTNVITRSKLSARKYYKAFTHIILNPRSREEAKEMLAELGRTRDITSGTVCMLGEAKEVYGWLAQYNTGRVNVRHFPSGLSCEDALAYFHALESNGPGNKKTATAG